MKSTYPIALFFAFLFYTSLYGQSVRTSLVNGNFNNPSVWDCSCIPATNDTIIIVTGDTVSLVANTTIGGVYIQSGAQIDNNGSRLSVNGDYNNDGDHTGSGDIWMLGVNARVAGTGSISNGNDFEIRANGIIMRSTANLSKTGGGNFRVIGARTFTNFGRLTTTRNITGNNANSTFHNESGAVLIAGRNVMNTGILIANDINNSVTYNRTGNQAVKTPSGSTYYNLTIDGTNRKNMQGNLTISNDLIISGGQLRALGNDLDIKGDLLFTGGVFTESTGEVIFSGTGNQTYSGLVEERFFDLTINKASGELVLNGDIEVSGTLNLQSGTVDATSNTLTVGFNTGATQIGALTRTNGYVKGTLSRYINTGTTNYSFPVGDNSNYLPVDITFTSISNGRLNVRYSPSFPGSQGLPLQDGADSIFQAFSEGFWRLTDTSGLAGSVYNVQMTANGFTSYAINPSTRLISRSQTGNNWQANGSHSPASSPNVFRNGLNSLPLEFTLGDTTRCTIPSPNTSVISGLVSVCKNASGVNYSVVNTPGSTYLWTITGGTQASGGSSNSITVNWGNNGITGQVQVIEYNGCEYGTPVTLSVDIAPFDPVEIVGNSTGFDGTTDNVYYIAEQTGYTYNWTVTGNATRNGSGSNDTILVDFTASGLAYIDVFLSNVCGNSITLQKEITVESTIKSIATGNWTNTNTWDCGCNPGNNATVQIQANHTVTSTVTNEQVGSLIIDSLGTLNITGSRIRINSELRNTGSITGTGQVRMNQTASVISGTGSWTSHTGALRFQAGVHTISTESTIDKPGGNINLQNNANVLNNGYVSTPNAMSGTNSATWSQQTNSYLQTANINWTNGTFFASAEGNTVVYSGTGSFTRTVRYPVSGIYYNLEINGNQINSTYQINTGDLTILNDLTINGGVFDASASNFNVTLDGNWLNNAGTFDPRAASVLLTGSNKSINRSTRETFYNLQLDNNAVINSNTPLTIENDLTLNSGSSLDMNNANDYQLNVQGDVNNSGIINFYQNEFLLDGSAAQSVAGDFDTYDITINNIAGVNINSGTTTLSHNLDINAGQLNTGGNLVMLSTVSETAKITDLTGGGSVTGNVTVQRYLNEGFGWYLLGSPVTGSDLSDWNNEIYMSGFPGSDGNAGSFISVNSYDESTRGVGNPTDSGYVEPSSSADAITPGKGWFVYYQTVKPGITTNTMDAIGPLYTGSYSTGSLSYTNSGLSTENGWHIVGNPYASPVEFSLLSLSNVANNTGYVRSSSGGYFDIVNDNIDYVYSHEAFWVQVNSGGGSVTFNENDKADVIDDYNARKASTSSFGQPLKMILSIQQFPGYEDYSVLRFGGDSNSVNYDPVFGESRKLGNSLGYYPNISSFSELDSSDIYYNTLNPEESFMRIPLRVWTKYNYNRDRDYTLTFEGIADWKQNNHCAILYDSLLGTSTVLDVNNDSYTWKMNDTIKYPRLYLEYLSPVTTETEPISCFNAEDGRIEVMGMGTGIHKYTWRNHLGNVIHQDSTSNGSLMENLAPGHYSIEVTNNGACGTMMAQVILNNPEPVLADFEVETENIEVGDTVVFKNKSVNADTYTWTFGDGEKEITSDPVHIYTEVGEYDVELTALQNEVCTSSLSKRIRVSELSVNVPEIVESVEKDITIYSFDKELRVLLSLEQSERIQMEIQDVLGRIIYTEDYGTVNQVNQSYTFTELNGMYIVRLSIGESSESKKVFFGEQ